MTFDSRPVVTLLQTTELVDVGPEELADYEPALIRAVWFLVGFLIVVGVGWYVVEPVVSRAVRRNNRRNKTMQEAMSRYTRLASVVVALFVGAGVAGYGGFLSSSALVFAAATLAIGVAGQAVVGSLISGLVLVFDPEFNVGNYVEWDDGEGAITSITLRVTRVETPDGELVTVPNTLLTSQAVRRPYGRKRYRVVEHVGVSYDDDLDDAIEGLRRAARRTDGVVEDPEPDAYLEEFGDDAVVLRCHYWLMDPRDTDVFDLRSRFARNAKQILEDADVSISPASKRELTGRVDVRSENSDDEEGT